MTLTSELVDDAATIGDDVLAGWRRLATAASLPYSRPEWMLGFWRGLHAPAAFRLVVVRDGRSVVGLGPFYGVAAAPLLGGPERRLLGAGLGQRCSPLAEPGAEAEVARLLATALASDRPAPSVVRLDAIDAGSPWPSLMGAGWPGRGARVRIDSRAPAPVVTMAASHGAWRRTRSRNFRSQLSRSRRAVAARGAIVRRSRTPGELERDLAALFELHARRFASHRRRTVLERYRAAVSDAAGALLAGGGARLWVIDREGEVVAAQLHLLAGERLCFWNGGFDPGWERERPGLVLLEQAVDDAHELGARVLDLGAGAAPYKLRFADADEPLGWATLVARDARYPLARARLAPAGAAAAARRLARRLPPGLRERLRELSGGR